MDLKTSEVAKVIGRIVNKPKVEGDKRMDRLRTKLEKELKRFIEDPTNMGIVDNITRHIAELEDITSDEVSKPSHDRAKTNVAVASSRMRRTHYAAYMAGKWSDSDDLGDDFKSWMHNAAADGAISLGETIDQAVKNSKAGFEEKGLLKVFRSGAYEDARRFLDLSKPFHPDSPLTKYNSARVDILSKEPERRRLGIETLLSIKPPSDQSRRAEISWHLNNYECFKNSEHVVRHAIRTNDPDRLEIIDHQLKNNAEEAERLVDRISWDNQTEHNRLVMVTFSVGLAGCSYLGIDPDALTTVQDLIKHGVEIIAGLTNSTTGDEVLQASFIGDGGLAYFSGDEVLRATFGDGGLA